MIDMQLLMGGSSRAKRLWLPPEALSNLLSEKAPQGSLQGATCESMACFQKLIARLLDLEKILRLLRADPSVSLVWLGGVS